MPALHRPGISVLQCPSFDFETKLVSVETRLIHNSGEWMSGTCSALPRDHKNVQAVGSTITYLKRYGLQSMTGCPSEDDDGNAASPPPRQRRARRTTVVPPPPASNSPVTGDYLKAECEKVGVELQQLTFFLIDNERAAPMNMWRAKAQDMFVWLAGDGADQVRSHVRPSEG